MKSLRILFHFLVSIQLELKKIALIFNLKKKIINQWNRFFRFFLIFDHSDKKNFSFNFLAEDFYFLYSIFLIHNEKKIFLFLNKQIWNFFWSAKKNLMREIIWTLLYVSLLLLKLLKEWEKNVSFKYKSLICLNTGSRLRSPKLSNV